MTESFEALMKRGEELTSLDRRQEANIFFQKAAERCEASILKDPGNHNLWVQKGVALVPLGQRREAIEAFDRALSLKADSPQAWKEKAFALACFGRHEEALSLFSRAIALNPNYYDAWLSRSYSLLRLGQIHEALVGLDRAIKIDPKRPEAWTNKAFTLMRLNRKREALSTIQSARQALPHDLGVVQTEKLIRHQCKPWLLRLFSSLEA